MTANIISSLRIIGKVFYRDLIFGTTTILNDAVDIHKIIEILKFNKHTFLKH